MIPIVIGVFEIELKSLEKGLEDLVIEDYSIVKIGQNTEKSPSDLRRLTVTRNPMDDHQLTLVRKTRKEYTTTKTTTTKVLKEEELI